MPCPICSHAIGSGADHRRCVFRLLNLGTIQTVEEWEALASDTKPKTIRKGRVRAVLPKE
jgi:hypothetical protein